MRRRRADRSWFWRRRRYGLRGRELASHEAHFVPFTAQTRMSGVNLDGREIRKGASDAIAKYISAVNGNGLPERRAGNS